MKQYSTPLIIKDDKAVSLEKKQLGSKDYNENWIQKLCFDNPNLLPFVELEPIFNGMIPICRELATESGYADLLYINTDGFITIGECKLWRNPESRRKVVGQILDYAKDLSKWNYSKFESECLKAGKYSKKSLFDIISKDQPDIEEPEFIDNVQKNLEKGRFLLLIIGDGIQENMEDLVNYIHRSGNLHFTLGLIELPVYENKEKNELIITPRILAKTKEIERIIYRISDKSIEEDNQLEQMKEKSQTISEKVYFERLEKSIGAEMMKEVEQLLATFDSQFNIKPSLGKRKKGTINLKLPNDYNFGTIRTNGEVQFFGNGRWKDDEGKLFSKYIEKITNIVNGQTTRRWGEIKKANGDFLNIIDLLGKKNEWINVLEETIGEIYRLEEDND